MKTLDSTALFLLAEGEMLKQYIDGEKMYKRYEALVAELDARKPQEIPEGKKLMRDPFVGYVLVDAR